MNEKTIDQLRDEGYCIVVFTPEELRDANPEKVADRMIEEGWTIIDCLQ